VAEVKIVVAGKEVVDPVQVVQDYVKTRTRTCNVFDLPAGTYDSLSPEVLDSTRIVRSQISRKQGEWFIRCAETAPWHRVPQEARVVDAVPDARGSLYDDAVTLWRHYMNSPDRPSQVSIAKISKVLHAMRPHFFPILDSRVMRRYRSLATDEARRLAVVRPDLGHVQRAFWAAVRIDLERSADGLNAVRRELGQSEHHLVRQWSGHVSDVRLHDVVAWS